MKVKNKIRRTKLKPYGSAHTYIRSCLCSVCFFLEPYFIFSLLNAILSRTFPWNVLTFAFNLHFHIICLMFTFPKNKIHIKEKSRKACNVHSMELKAWIFSAAIGCNALHTVHALYICATNKISCCALWRYVWRLLVYLNHFLNISTSMILHFDIANNNNIR